MAGTDTCHCKGHCVSIADKQAISKAAGLHGQRGGVGLPKMQTRHA